MTQFVDFLQHFEFLRFSLKVREAPSTGQTGERCNILTELLDPLHALTRHGIDEARRTSRAIVQNQVPDTNQERREDAYCINDIFRLHAPLADSWRCLT